MSLYISIRMLLHRRNKKTNMNSKLQYIVSRHHSTPHNVQYTPSSQTCKPLQNSVHQECQIRGIPTSAWKQELSQQSLDATFTVMNNLPNELLSLMRECKTYARTHTHIHIQHLFSIQLSNVFM